ncbi:MAG TPA: MFS transporter [Mycobacteriales bacterium]|nr:MFS transporter [Mycobacteriales bacterium]
MTTATAGVEEREVHRAAFTYLFLAYLTAAVGETLISPLFPLIRDEMGLSASQQASLTAVLTVCIASCNVAGGWLGHRGGDRRMVRLAAVALALGGLASGTAHSYAALLVGQVLIGCGSGLFWASGMATIGRLYARKRSRAVAAYGLAYSAGLGVAAFAGNLGAAHWRWAFFATSVLAAGLVLVAPPLRDAEPGPGGEGTWQLLRTSLAHPLYRMSLITALVAGMTNYILLGFAPLLYTERGATLSLIATMIGVGRVVSSAGKYGAGWLMDRFGGPATGVCLMASIAVLGLPFFLLPTSWGAPVVIPLLVVSAGLFTVSNILSVQALPSRSTFSLGAYRAFLVAFSAVLSSLVAVLLHAVGLRTIMLGSLVVPALASVALAAAIRAGSAKRSTAVEAAVTLHL